jgi:hypothetical protein
MASSTPKGMLSFPNMYSDEQNCPIPNTGKNGRLKGKIKSGKSKVKVKQYPALTGTLDQSDCRTHLDPQQLYESPEHEQRKRE